MVGPDQALTGPGVAAGTRIVSGSGTSWVVSVSQTVAGPVAMTSRASLPPGTYYNGSLGTGEGATITGQADGALAVDGTAVTAGMRILVKDELSPATNGIYTVTRPGDGGTTYLLVRATDFDSGTCPTSAPTSCVTPNSYVLVMGGQIEQSSGWLMTTRGVITVGVSPLVWQQFAAANPGLGYTPLNPANNLSDVNSTAISLLNLGGSPQVASNAALKALAVPSAGARVTRSGFTTAGDGGATEYVYSATNCSLGPGVGDNFSQVAPTAGGGCWIIDKRGARFDARAAGASCGAADATAALQAVSNYLAVSGGGEIDVPCPMTIAGTLTLGNSVKLHGVGPIYYKGMVATGGGSPQTLAWPAATGPALNCTNTSGTACIVVAGLGVEVDNLNLGNPEPTPGGGTYTPTVFPPVIATSYAANWNGLNLHHLTFTSAWTCIDLEGSPSYTANGISGAQWTIADVWFNPCLAYGIIEHHIDNTGDIRNVEYDFWWNRNVGSLLPYMKANSVGMLWNYAANTRLNGVEFFANKIAIDQQNATVAGGFNATFAANAIQGTNISFNEVCQAMGNESGTALVSTGRLANVILYQDTMGTPYCALDSPAAIDLAATNGANWMMTNVQAGFVQTLAAIGSGSTLHFDGLDVQSYSYFASGAPAFKVSSGADLMITNTNFAAIRPAAAPIGGGSAGNLEGPGLDSTQGYMTNLCNGGGSRGLEGAACLQGGQNVAGNTGALVLFDAAGTQQGFINANNGKLFLSPRSGASTVTIGTSVSNQNLVNMTPLPTAPPSGTGVGYVCFDNQGNLYVKSACP